MTVGGTRTATFGQYKVGRDDRDRLRVHGHRRQRHDERHRGGRSGVTVTAHIGTSTTYPSTKTDAAGKLSFSLPTPAAGSGTTYSIGCAMVAGCYPTTSPASTRDSCSLAAAVSGNNFRFWHVLELELLGYPATAMVATDPWENDGSGATPNTKGDQTSCTWPASSVFRLGAPANNWTSRAARRSRASRSLFDELSEYALQPLRGHAAQGSTNRAPTSSAGRPAPTTSNSGPAPVRSSRRTPAPSSRHVRRRRVLSRCARSTARRHAARPHPRYAFEHEQGTVEIQQSDDATSPNYTKQETYPSAGQRARNDGEAQQIVLADMDRDGDKDLVIATSTGTYSGQVIVLDNIGRTRTAAGAIATCGRCPRTTPNSSRSRTWTATAIRTSCSARRRARPRAASSSTATRTRRAPGRTRSARASRPAAVLSMAVADLGGSSASDVAVGYVTNTTSGAGGVRIFYNVGGTIRPRRWILPGGAV